MQRKTPLFAALLSAATLAALASPVDIKINGVTYRQFSSTLDATSGAHVYLNASNDVAQTDVRATQRSLGYREVTYKTALFNTLAFTSASSSVDAGGTTSYNFGKVSTKTTVPGYWANKDVPIIIGPDGKAYITDGHHTVAGFLATNHDHSKSLIPGLDHPIIGHVIATYYDVGTGPVAPTDVFWKALLSSNNAFLYGRSGNGLAIPADAGYAGLQPLMPSALSMPLIPGTRGSGAMMNDPYRSLTWGLADGITLAATNKGKALKGFSKINSLGSAMPRPDINFVEFYWADFLRNRVIWDDGKAGSALGTNTAVFTTAANGQANLIAAPISFFASVANATALAKSEVYRDQFGRTIGDYAGSQYSDNTRVWAQASIRNGLAKQGDTYHMFLIDGATIQGDLTPSALTGVVNSLHIDTTAGLFVAGSLANFRSIAVNSGASILTNWKDALPQLPNSLLTIPAGSGAVVFTGRNDYTQLTSLALDAGSLELNTPADVDLAAVITGKGAFLKSGVARLTLSGASPFSGAVSVKEGTLVVDGALASAVVSVSSGATLSGIGKVGAASNSGIVSPGGNSTGSLAVAGDFTQGSSGALLVQLGGVDTGSHDTLVVQGIAQLGGTLVLQPLNGYTPKQGDTYKLITAQSVSGSFAAVSNHLGKGLDFRISVEDGVVVIVFTGQHR